MSDKNKSGVVHELVLWVLYSWTPLLCPGPPLLSFGLGSELASKGLHEPHRMLLDAAPVCIGAECVCAPAKMQTAPDCIILGMITRRTAASTFAGSTFQYN